ncbi:hypothetical protein [Streptomyces griseorubiginosus]|uniref:hypothetical protein n=1 Tax=Streptomyces griseorubiginosus TaxID=67304 RepID=UPI00364FF189
MQEDEIVAVVAEELPEDVGPSPQQSQARGDAASRRKSCSVGRNAVMRCVTGPGRQWQWQKPGVPQPARSCPSAA